MEECQDRNEINRKALPIIEISMPKHCEFNHPHFNELRDAHQQWFRNVFSIVLQFLARVPIAIACGSKRRHLSRNSRSISTLRSPHNRCFSSTDEWNTAWNEQLTWVMGGLNFL